MINMTPEEIRKIIKEEMESTFAYVFSKHIQILDGRKIIVGTGTGTQIGTETTQKIGFYAKAPVAQQAAITAPDAMGITYNQAEQNSQNSAINNIITTLENLGIIATN